MNKILIEEEDRLRKKERKKERKKKKETFLYSEWIFLVNSEF